MRLDTSATSTGTTPAGAAGDVFDLDVSVAAAAPAAALVCSTDNGCDTQKQGDC
ncbi:FxLD family lanthipeptide [Actinomadura napierensis]|uniref:FxLD family lantipeptide n=1 Tax=Actinomadura napierensis TaxID=267854 RepID=A0ABN2ZW62_9ACTN